VLNQKKNILITGKSSNILKYFVIIYELNINQQEVLALGSRLF